LTVASRKVVLSVQRVQRDNGENENENFRR
jgi:hypothetical protein